MIGKRTIVRVASVLMLLGTCCNLSAQKWGVKTNLFYDATTTLNVAAEYALSPKWSLELGGNYNPWTFSDNRKWKHWLVQPEARYWLCNKFMGGFFAVHALAGQFNMGNWNTDFNFLGSDLSQLKTNRYEGWMAGAGVAWGYAWPLSRHLNLEAEIGFGYAWMNYDRFACPKCGEKIETDKTHHYVGPTKAAINLMYVF